MTTFEQQTEPETAATEIDRCLDAAVAAVQWGHHPPAERAPLLDVVADALDEHATELIAEAAGETGLTEGRLTGELTRTSVQLRMFAEVLRDGSYLRIVIDREDPDFILGARPDLRRYLVPMGPVLVFAAGNFPFAFSVAGADTAAALAAGCPVVLKAHPGHPRTSQLTAEIVRMALTSAGAPAGLLTMITGRNAGVRALRDSRVAAGAFTGSVQGGRALFDIAASRDVPIPFYGELGSINPAVMTSGAVRERGEQIAEGFVASFTLGAGQFCTKPGILLLPTGSDLPTRIAHLVEHAPAARLLTTKIADAYRERLAGLATTPGVTSLVSGQEDTTASDVPEVTPALLHAGTATNLRDHRSALLEECFGPTAVIAEYDSEEELHAVLTDLQGSLTVTVHSSDQPDEAEREQITELTTQVTDRCGRIVFNDWPTGVSVTPAQHHGGPYPATTAPAHTSVGTAAIDRFLRPIAYQNAPDAVLPLALREANPLGLPRTVNNPGHAKGWARDGTGNGS